MCIRDRVNTLGIPTGPENPHGNAFVAQETLLATEKEAQRRVNSPSARFWRVVNPSKKNRLGRPVGYLSLIHISSDSLENAGMGPSPCLTIVRISCGVRLDPISTNDGTAGGCPVSSAP